MVRSIRLNEKGVVYHVISRFVDRNWYIQSDDERSLYLMLLGRALSESDWLCLAYAIMSNHIHLALLAGEEPLGHWIRRVHSPFANALNRDANRIGPIFVRGPKDAAIPNERVGSLIAYIHNNPVRAGVVKHARESSWTSHQAYAALTSRPAWLDVAVGLRYFGFDRVTLESAVADEGNERRDISLAEIRGRARARGGIEVATPRLGERVEVPLVSRPYAHIRPAPSTIIAAVAEMLGITRHEICSRQHRVVTVLARRIAAYSGYALGLTGAEMAAAMGISHQAISKLRAKSLDAAERGMLDHVMTAILATEAAAGSVAEVASVP
jgi:hypothetical protein